MKKKTKKTDSYYYASQWQLMFHKFRKHKLAVAGGILLIFFYFCAIFGNFIAPQGTEQYNGEYSNCGPTPIHFFHEGKWEGPFVYGLKRERDPETYRRFRSEEEYPSPMTMKKAAAWLEDNHDADNFLLWVEGFDPHEPFDVPQKYIDLYRDEDGDDYEGMPCYWPEYRRNLFTDQETRHLNVRYKALLTMTDHYIGKILDVLDRYDMWQDTMVIFTTDHGYMLGEHGYMAKNYMPAYNEVFHIPLVIWHPQAKVKRSAALTQNIDLFPTLLEQFGVDQGLLHGPIHGRNLMPLLTGEKQTVRDGVIYGYFGKSVNYTDGRYTYLRCAADESNRPLNVYTAIPTTLRQYYGVGCIARQDYDKIGFGHLSWTDYPVYRFPADIIDFKNPSQEYSRRSEYNQTPPACTT